MNNKGFRRITVTQQWFEDILKTKRANWEVIDGILFDDAKLIQVYFDKDRLTWDTYWESDEWGNNEGGNIPVISPTIRTIEVL